MNKNILIFIMTFFVLVNKADTLKALGEPNCPGKGTGLIFDKSPAGYGFKKTSLFGIPKVQKRAFYVLNNKLIWCTKGLKGRKRQMGSYDLKLLVLDGIVKRKDSKKNSLFYVVEIPLREKKRGRNLLTLFKKCADSSCALVQKEFSSFFSIIGVKTKVLIKERPSYAEPKEAPGPKASEAGLSSVASSKEAPGPKASKTGPISARAKVKAVPGSKTPKKAISAKKDETNLRNKAATKIQSVFRMHQARKKYKATLEALIKAQSTVRMALKKKKYKEARAAAAKIQVQAKTFLAQKKYQRALVAAVSLQKIIREHQSRKKMKEINNAAIKVQTAARGFLERKKLAREQAATKIQATVRGFLAKQKYIEAGKAAIKLQAFVRGYQENKKFKAMKDLALRVQAQARGFLIRQELEKKKNIIIKVQAMARGFLQRKKHSEFRKAVTQAQSAVRKNIAEKKFRQAKIAAVKIQSAIRAYLARKHTNQLKKVQEEALKKAQEAAAAIERQAALELARRRNCPCLSRCIAAGQPYIQGDYLNNIPREETQRDPRQNKGFGEVAKAGALKGAEVGGEIGFGVGSAGFLTAIVGGGVGAGVGSVLGTTGAVLGEAAGRFFNRGKLRVLNKEEIKFKKAVHKIYLIDPFFINPPKAQAWCAVTRATAESLTHRGRDIEPEGCQGIPGLRKDIRSLEHRGLNRGTRRVVSFEKEDGGILELHARFNDRWDRGTSWIKNCNPDLDQPQGDDQLNTADFEELQRKATATYDNYKKKSFKYLYPRLKRSCPCVDTCKNTSLFRTFGKVSNTCYVMESGGSLPASCDAGYFGIALDDTVLEQYSLSPGHGRYYRQCVPEIDNKK